MARTMTREEFLAGRLSERQDWWIRVRCGTPTCWPVTLPCRLLARNYGDGSIPDVLRRLRCRHCGGRLVTAIAMDNGAGRIREYPDTQEIPLLP